MARYWFGRSLTDWTMTADSTGVVFVASGVGVTFWSAAIGGVQYTDLLDVTGQPVTSVTSSDGGDGLTTGTIPRFQGPDGVTELWADGGSGRYLMVATSLGATVTDLHATVLALQQTVELLGSSIGSVRYNTETGTWPARPSDSRIYIWFGPSAPAAIPDGDYWINPEPA